MPRKAKRHARKAEAYSDLDSDSDDLPESDSEPLISGLRHGVRRAARRGLPANQRGSPTRSERVGSMAGDCSRTSQIHYRDLDSQKVFHIQCFKLPTCISFDGRGSFRARGPREPPREPRALPAENPGPLGGVAWRPAPRQRDPERGSCSRAACFLDPVILCFPSQLCYC